MNIKIFLITSLIITSGFSEIKNEKYDKVLENKKTIILKPRVHKEKAEDINCSYGNYMDCAEKKYNKIEGKSFMDKASTLFGGKEEEIEEEEDDTTIGEDIENLGSSIWSGTKGLASDAGRSTKNFIKRKFDESWEDAKKEMEENNKKERNARAKARGHNEPELDK